MSQTTYNPDPSIAMAGMPVDDSADEHIDTGFAIENLDFGVALQRSNAAATPQGVRVPRRNVATVTLSTDLITGNVTNGTINGAAIAPVTYATSHAATMAAIGAAFVAAAAALAVPVTVVATVSGDVLTLTAVDASLLLASVAVTAGASQPTVTLAHTTGDTTKSFQGISRQLQIPPRRTDGLNGYGITDSVAVVRQGRVWVPISHAVVEGDDVYLDYSSGNEGKFTNQSTAPNVGPLPGCRFRGTYDTTGLSLAPVEVNLP